MEAYHLPDDTDASIVRARTRLTEHRGRQWLIAVPASRSVHNSPVLARMASSSNVITARTMWRRGGDIRRVTVLAAWLAKPVLDELARWGPAEVIIIPGDPVVTERWQESHSSQ